ncbi:uncharacterized protein, partial [Clytia hemisphaerica]|uniref:uncharacterized protein n=1 Tax=Clytia hemisphaerica TaxID=252671 RepID=UPI0034D567BF
MPSKDNRRYYPKKTDIRSYVYRAAMKLRFSKVDQEELDHRVKEWKKEQPEDSFFYRRYGGEDIPVYNEKGEKVDSLPKGKRLLFVHQTKRQRRLLAKYGNFVCLLDATYKTTKYSLPLFFIATRTNVDYQVIPLCYFHREQAWERWLKTEKNGMRDVKEFILDMLRAIAKSETENETKTTINFLKESEIWKSEKATKMREWLTKKWLPEFKRWVYFYRKDLLPIEVNTTNGVERKNKDFKAEYLKPSKQKSVSGTKIRTVDAPPQYRRYKGQIPIYLRDRPRKVVLHCREKLNLARGYGDGSVMRHPEHEDVYVVRKGRNGSAYNVMFVTEGGMPSCECFSWKKTKLPCKHMFSIILNNLEHWESFSEFYRHLPYMTLDEEICPSPRSVGQEQQPSSGAQLPTEDITMASDDDSKADPFFPELPRKVTKSLTRRSHCREMLKEVMSATHNYGLDEETIEELEERILDLKIFLEEKLPRDDGLVIESKKEAMKQVSNKNVKQNEENPASSNSCNNKGATFIELPSQSQRRNWQVVESTKEAEPNENDVNEVDKE